MISVLQCLWHLFIHKGYVFYYGSMLNVSAWQLFTHDLSKLKPIQLKGYVQYHANKTQKTQTFYNALHDHIRTAPHHWNYWVTVTTESTICLPMPDRYIREMVADWAAAGYQKLGYFDLVDYYKEYGPRMILHAETRERVERYIDKLEHLQRKIPGAPRRLQA